MIKTIARKKRPSHLLILFILKMSNIFSGMKIHTKSFLSYRNLPTGPLADNVSCLPTAWRPKRKLHDSNWFVAVYLVVDVDINIDTEKIQYISLYFNLDQRYLFVWISDDTTYFRNECQGWCVNLKTWSTSATMPAPSRKLGRGCWLWVVGCCWLLVACCLLLLLVVAAVVGGGVLVVAAAATAFLSLFSDVSCLLVFVAVPTAFDALDVTIYTSICSRWRKACKFARGAVQVLPWSLPVW